VFENKAVLVAFASILSFSTVVVIFYFIYRC
jgi:hypothetical protein